MSLEFIGLLLILYLAAYLRLVNVARNPSWYTDEATHLNIPADMPADRFAFDAQGGSLAAGV